MSEKIKVVVSAKKGITVTDSSGKTTYKRTVKVTRKTSYKRTVKVTRKTSYHSSRTTSKEMLEEMMSMVNLSVPDGMSRSDRQRIVEAVNHADPKLTNEEAIYRAICDYYFRNIGNGKKMIKMN
jgi:hypothetical protein